jgi:ERCC4-type nuclease
MHNPRDRDLRRLQQLGGVGPVTAEKLLQHFGSLYGVWAAAHGYTDEIARVDGISREEAMTFYKKFSDAGIERSDVMTAEQVHRKNATYGGWHAGSETIRDEYRETVRDQREVTL